MSGYPPPAKPPPGYAERERPAGPWGATWEKEIVTAWRATTLARAWQLAQGGERREIEQSINEIDVMLQSLKGHNGGSWRRRFHRARRDLQDRLCRL